jgi:hypothetical protein
VPCKPPHGPLLHLEPHRHTDHSAHDAHTLLRSETDRRISLLLYLWLQPLIDAPVQDCLDHHLRIDHDHADGRRLNP